MSGFHPDAELRALARRVSKLGYVRVTPEGFHAEKSSIEAAMMRLANRLEHDAGAQPSTSYHKTPKDRSPRLRAANDNAKQAPFFKDR